jgi:hypothetical protein
LSRPSKEQIMIFFIFNIAILYNITVSIVQLFLLLGAKVGLHNHGPPAIPALHILLQDGFTHIWVWHTYAIDFTFRESLLLMNCWGLSSGISATSYPWCLKIAAPWFYIRPCNHIHWINGTNRHEITMVLTLATFSHPALYNFCFLGQCWNCSLKSAISWPSWSTEPSWSTGTAYLSGTCMLLACMLFTLLAS